MYFDNAPIHAFFYSFESLLMAIITSSVLLIVISICLFSKKIMLNMGFKLILAFLLFSFLRFIFPLELPFSISIYFPETWSGFIYFFRHPYLYCGDVPLSLWNILKIVWFIGSIFQFIRIAKTYFRSSRYMLSHGVNITSEEPYKHIIEDICQKQHKKNKFTIISIDAVPTPVAYGIFKPYILIPSNLNLSDNDLYYALSHEAAHFFHNDLFIKAAINLLVIIYWWNPLVYILQKQSSLLLEMRVDRFIVQNDQTKTTEYLNCLIHIAEYVSEQPNIPKKLSASFTTNNASDLKKRFNMLCHYRQNKIRDCILNILLTLFLICVFYLSYRFIFEGYYYPEEISIDNAQATNRYFLPLETTYLIDNGNGTYDVYLDSPELPNHYLETVDSLEGFTVGFTIYYLEKGKFKE